MKNQICGGTRSFASNKEKECEGPGADVLEVELHDIFMALLMVNNISMSTMDLLSPPPHLFFFSPAFSHTHTQLREKMTSLQLSIHCTSIGLNGPAQQKVT